MKDDALALELAAGATVADAARRVGISERTAWRRLQDPAFKARVAQTRRDAFVQAIGVLQSASVKAAKTLRDLLVDESAGIRLRSAVAVLETASRLGELVELGERLAALESRQAA
ncbi:MAG TPA: helix-turn-helix domain-containing protein [Pirellulales bacterium]|nr:helix-turn-helix domain-containing protein [Pirellulales bacterium]